MNKGTVLPLVVARLILRHATRIDIVNSYEQWKPLLPLLSICRSWRELAQPMVYRTLYVFEDSTSETPSVITNMDLIMRTHSTRFVKAVFIDSDCNLSFQMFVNRYIPALASKSYGWLGVQSLTIVAQGKEPTETDSALTAIGDQQTSTVSVLTDCIIESMPNIKEISIKLDSELHANGAIGEKLASAFSNRLTKFGCNHQFALDATKDFSNITDLSLRLDPVSELVLPKLNLACLKTLELNDISPGFTWDAFSKHIDNDYIEFQKLEKLKLAFSKTNTIAVSNNAPVFTVSFPVLHKLIINQLPNQIFIDTKYRFSNCLIKINTAHALSNLDIIAGWDLKYLKHLRVFLGGVEHSEMDMFYRLTNRWYGKDSLLNYSKLSLWTTSFDLDVARIDWTRLKSIHMVKQCNYSMLIALIQKLSSLLALSVINIYVDSVSAAPEDCTLEPLRTCIESLVFVSIDCDEFTKQQMLDTIYSIILRLPKLRIASVEERMFRHRDLFREKYSSRYPHIKNIEFEPSYE